MLHSGSYFKFSDNKNLNRHGRSVDNVSKEKRSGRIKRQAGETRALRRKQCRTIRQQNCPAGQFLCSGHEQRTSLTLLLKYFWVLLNWSRLKHTKRTICDASKCCIKSVLLSRNVTVIYIQLPIISRSVIIVIFEQTVRFLRSKSIFYVSL